MAHQTLELQLREYLEENGFCVAVTPGISISRSTGDDLTEEITVCGTLSSVDRMHDLEVFSTHDSYGHLVATFALTSVADLEKINANMLHQLYLAEQGGILCSVLDDRKTLIFRKRGNSTIVSDDCDVVIETINQVYQTNEAFIEHTLQRCGIDKQG